MSEPAIRLEGLSKCYRLGAIGRHTLVEEAQHLWCRLRGKDSNAVLGKVGGASVPVQADKEFWALRDVSFEVEAGEVLGVIGGNGAGKSTLLKILSRITEPTLGRAMIRGRVGSLLEVGTGFHPELTGRENVFMNGTILGMRKREVAAKFDEIVAFSGIEKFIDTPVKRYSSGMYVRLAFAVAAHLEPEILIVDEVLAVGDAEFQKRCLGKMGEVAKAGRTVLFVSHNMAAVSRLCTRCLWLKNGEVVRLGGVEMVDDYLQSGHDAGLSAGAKLDRLENDFITLKGVALVDDRGGPGDLIRMGEGITLRLKICAKVEIALASLQFAVFDDCGNKIASMHSRLTDIRPLTLEEGKTVQVTGRIRSMNLNAGRYFVNVGILDHVAKRNLCPMERAMSFEVTPADVYGTSFSPEKDALVYFPVQWEFTPCDG